MGQPVPDYGFNSMKAPLRLKVFLAVMGMMGVTFTIFMLWAIINA